MFQSGDYKMLEIRDLKVRYIRLQHLSLSSNFFWYRRNNDNAHGCIYTEEAQCENTLRTHIEDALLDILYDKIIVEFTCVL